MHNARICVQLEMDKPLWHHVTIGRFTQAIQYENVPNLCFACGRIGHKLETCIAQQPTLHEATVLQTDSHDHQNHLRQTDKDLAPNEFGSWMLVTRRTPKQRLDVRNKPVRTPGLHTQHAETVPHQNVNGMIKVPAPPVGPTGFLPHTDPMYE